MRSDDRTGCSKGHASRKKCPFNFFAEAKALRFATLQKFEGIIGYVLVWKGTVHGGPRLRVVFESLRAPGSLLNRSILY